MSKRMMRQCWVVLPLVVASLGAGSRETSLVSAIKNDDAVAARALILQKSGVNTPEADGSTALHWAVHRDDLKLVDQLIAAGANVKAVTRYGVTPISLAAENGNAGIIERLLKAGADANAAMPLGETALMTAARTGRADAIRVLLAHGANPNAAEETRHQTALMWAAAVGNAQAIKALVEGGADINARSINPPKPRGGRGTNTGGNANQGPNAVVRPGTGANPNAKPDANKDPKTAFGALSPVLFAVRRGHIEATQALVDAGANLNDAAVMIEGEGLESALILAVANGAYEMASWLLDHGADPKANGPGWTALHQLARARSEPGVNGTRTNVGWVPGPALIGNMSGLDLARKLVKSGADINAQMTKELKDGYRIVVSRVGATPIALAAKCLDAELVRLLVSLGADPNIATIDSVTPLMLAAGVGMKSPDEDSGWHEHALPTVQALLEAGVHVNAEEDRGWTALHGAAFRGVNQVVQLLVDKGAKMDVRAYQAGRLVIEADRVQAEEGWLPVDIADGGMITSGIYYRQADTAALLRKLMKEHGLPVPPDRGLDRGVKK